MSHTIAIITVVYKNYTVLEDFIKSLKDQSDKDFHLFIADLTEEPTPISYSDITMTVISGENLGYAHGVNLGIQEAIKLDITNFCVMNDDTYFKKDFVKSVRKSLQEQPNSLIGGKIYYAPGYEYHKDYYSEEEHGKVIWYAGGEVDWAHVHTKHIGVDEVDQGQYDQVVPTDFITGCLMLFDKKVVDTIGLWDIDYFLYYEDADYCERAKKAGIKLYYDPFVVIWHKNAQSTDGSGSKLHQKYQTKNRLTFGLKYAPLRTKLHLVKNHIVETLLPKNS